MVHDGRRGRCPARRLDPLPLAGLGVDRVTAEDGGPVLAAEPGRRFTFRWQPDGPDYSTTVEIGLEAVPEGTLVRVCESGYRDTPSGRRALLSCATGWGEALALLARHLERDGA